VSAVMHQLRELETRVRGWAWFAKAASAERWVQLWQSVSAFLDSPRACQRVLRTVEETATGDHPRDAGWIMMPSADCISQAI